MPLHHADPLPDHEPGGGLLGDRNLEGGAGQGERAADRQRLVAVAFEPLLDVEVEAGQPVVWRGHALFVPKWEMNMSKKLKLVFLGALLAVIGAISSPVLAANYNDYSDPGFNGGVSYGYNAGVSANNS